MADKPSPPETAASAVPVLEMRGIRKVFPGVVALDDVDFDVVAGEVHALLGRTGPARAR
jgi:ABC-type sugar transport system ATPase subunit